jgi:hypothetical protein
MPPPLTQASIIIPSLVVEILTQLSVGAFDVAKVAP